MAEDQKGYIKWRHLIKALKTVTALGQVDLAT